MLVMIKKNDIRDVMGNTNVKEGIVEGKSQILLLLKEI
jgi:hypothetical protein